MDPSKQLRFGSSDPSTAPTGSRGDPPRETKSGGRGSYGRGRGFQGRGSAPSGPISHDGVAAGSREAPSREAKSGGRSRGRGRGSAPPPAPEAQSQSSRSDGCAAGLDQTTPSIVFVNNNNVDMITEFLKAYRLNNSTPIPFDLMRIYVFMVSGDEKIKRVREQVIELLKRFPWLAPNILLVLSHDSETKFWQPKLLEDYDTRSSSIKDDLYHRALLQIASVAYHNGHRMPEIVARTKPNGLLDDGEGTHKAHASNPVLLADASDTIDKARCEVERLLREDHKGFYALLSAPMKDFSDRQFVYPYKERLTWFDNLCAEMDLRRQIAEEIEKAYRQGQNDQFLADNMKGKAVPCVKCKTEEHVYYPLTGFCFKTQSFGCRVSFIQ